MKKRGFGLLSVVASLFISMFISTTAKTISTDNATASISSQRFTKSAIKAANDEYGFDITTASNVKELDPDFEAAFSSSSYVSFGQSYRFTLTANGTQNFMLGYYGSHSNGIYSDKDYPLLANYQYVTEDGVVHQASTPIEKVSSSNPYDGIGPVISDNKASLAINIALPEKGKVDRDSLVLSNIFAAEKVVDEATKKTSWKPDLTKTYIIDDFSATKARRKENTDLTNQISAKAISYSTFGNYVSVNVELENNFKDFYLQTLKANLEDETLPNPNEQYDEFMENINKGTFTYYTGFTGISTGYFLVAYEDGTLQQRYVKDEGSISANLNLNFGKNTLNFILHDMKLEGLRGVYLCGIKMHLSIISVESGKDQGSTNMDYYLGALYLEPAAKPVSQVNHILIGVIIFLVTTLIYVALAVANYFYRKNKFKNDEFLRVNNRSFTKTAVIGYGAVVVLVMDIFFIFSRSNLFANSLAVFNPLDTFIVVLSIAAIFFIGYFAKFFVTAYKNHKDRKEAKRLKLDEDVDSDGTK